MLGLRRDAAESALLTGQVPDRRTDPLPVAGTIEIADALCAHGDLRLSTAAVLASRFPYVTPSGHIGDSCGRDPPDGTKAEGVCSDPLTTSCEGSFVDGGYAENSGLFTITQLWPTLREKIEEYNSDPAHVRKIAPLIVELDNHYQASLSATVPSGGTTDETLIPLATAFGSRNAMQTYARAAARRLLPAKCMITISPSLHPGLIAPLGWELSPSARDDLRAGPNHASSRGDGETASGTDQGSPLAAGPACCRRRGAARTGDYLSTNRLPGTLDLRRQMITKVSRGSTAEAVSIDPYAVTRARLTAFWASPSSALGCSYRPKPPPTGCQSLRDCLASRHVLGLHVPYRRR